MGFSKMMKHKSLIPMGELSKLNYPEFIKINIKPQNFKKPFRTRVPSAGKIKSHHSHSKSLVYSIDNQDLVHHIPKEK